MKDKKEFIDTFEDLRKRVFELAKNKPGAFWPDIDGIQLTADGVYVYDLVPRQYEQGDEIVSHLISWNDIDNYDEALARYKVEKDRIAAAESKAAEDWQRNYYEQLKAKFEKNT
jgi:hypothetical protein